jgi:hypothetical protein
MIDDKLITTVMLWFQSSPEATRASSKDEPCMVATYSSGLLSAPAQCALIGDNESQVYCLLPLMHIHSKVIIKRASIRLSTDEAIKFMTHFRTIPRKYFLCYILGPGFVCYITRSTSFG